MADYNSNIILGGQAPQFENPVDIASKAMQFKSLASKNQLEGIQLEKEQSSLNDEKAYRNAMNQNTKIDPETGKVNTDQVAVLKSLASNPETAHLAPKIGQQFAAQDLDVQTKKLNMQKELLSYGAQVLGGVSDQPSYENAMSKAEAIKPGSTSDWPKQFDPDFTKAKAFQSMSGKDQIDSQLRALDVENHKKQLEMDSYKAFGAPNPIQGPQGKEISKEDPANLVKRIPQHLQAKAYETLEAAQNTAKTAAQILEEFDKAAAERRSVSGMVKGVHAKAFHALMGPTFKDVEGTVRQAAMDNMNTNVTPNKIDSDSDVLVRRKALIGYLQSKAAAPMLKGYGIDLSKYESTRLDPKILAGPSHPHDDAAIKWAKSNPNDPRSAKILEVNGEQ